MGVIVSLMADLLAGCGDLPADPSAGLAEDEARLTELWPPGCSGLRGTSPYGAILRDRSSYQLVRLARYSRTVTEAVMPSQPHHLGRRVPGPAGWKRYVGPAARAPTSGSPCDRRASRLIGHPHAVSIKRLVGF
ncbi:MAG: hypothetical protein JWN52_860 [Actinomycetia bacterium]|nr:hypothetical protein [Actinomycetes bacterium]